MRVLTGEALRVLSAKAVLDSPGMRSRLALVKSYSDVRILSLTAFLLGLAHAAEIRSWTDVQDRKTEAALVRVDGPNVILKLKDGREVPFPLAKLSAADVSYVEKSRAPATSDKPADDRDKTLNFAAPWPDLIKFSEDPEIKTVEENAGTKHFTYESANYRYVSDVRLSKSVVKGFAVLFEATHLYCRTLPLAIDGGIKTEGKLQIQLFEKIEDYTAAGGPKGSAGVFIGGRNVVLVPLTSLGVRPVGSGYMFDHEKSSNTIPHELTHQLSPEGYFSKGAMGWFSEGIAEYVGNTRYRSGIFNVRGNQKDLIEYVTGYGAKEKGGRALGKKIKMPALKTFMLEDYATFQEQPQLSYGCGLLMVIYFLHMDGDGDGKRIKAYLKALHEGQDGVKALDLLLDGRDFAKLEADFVKAWSHKGVDFTFL